MSRLSVTPVGREASTVTMYISYGVSGLRSADQMRRFESSGLIENCVFRRLDQLVFIPSDRSDRLFGAVLNKFSLIQASIDNAVPRARVAELLAETQVLIGDLAMEKTRPSTVDLVRDLFTAYKQRNLTDARPRLDELRRQHRQTIRPSSAPKTKAGPPP